MTAKSLLLRLWAQSNGMANRAINTLTEDNRHHRLTPDSASAGFLLQHIGEAVHRIQNLTNAVPLDERNSILTVGGAKDEGQAGDVDAIRAIFQHSYQTVEAYLQHLPDEQLDEQVETARWGTMSRAETIGILLYHNGYHIGQAMLAIKRGKVWAEVLQR